MMVMCNKQHLSNIWIPGKVRQHWNWVVKERVLLSKWKIISILSGAMKKYRYSFVGILSTANGPTFFSKPIGEKWYFHFQDKSKQT